MNEHAPIDRVTAYRENDLFCVTYRSQSHWNARGAYQSMKQYESLMAGPSSEPQGIPPGEFEAALAKGEVPAEPSADRIERALNALVAEGETARWYIEQAFQDDDETTRRLMVEEVARAMLAATPPARDAGMSLTDAARDVLAERVRQISAEGWTTEHDDEHADGSMAQAAACYAHGSMHFSGKRGQGYVTLWPWDEVWWRHAPRRRQLVKAGALILAEIERLDRAAAQEKHYG